MGSSIVLLQAVKSQRLNFHVVIDYDNESLSNITWNVQQSGLHYRRVRPIHTSCFRMRFVAWKVMKKELQGMHFEMNLLCHLTISYTERQTPDLRYD